MTWQGRIKNAAVGLSRVDPKDNSTKWLGTLKDMAMNREQ